MAEHDTSDNERRQRLLALKRLEAAEEADQLITSDPFISWQRRRAARQAEEARKWLEENPEYLDLIEKQRDQNKDS